MNPDGLGGGRTVIDFDGRPGRDAQNAFAGFDAFKVGGNRQQTCRLCCTANGVKCRCVDPLARKAMWVLRRPDKDLRGIITGFTSMIPAFRCRSR